MLFMMEENAELCKYIHKEIGDPKDVSYIIAEYVAYRFIMCNYFPFGENVSVDKQLTLPQDVCEYLFGVCSISVRMLNYQDSGKLSIRCDCANGKMILLNASVYPEIGNGDVYENIFDAISYFGKHGHWDPFMMRK